MTQCEEHKTLAEDIAHIREAVNRIDHGLNGTNGSIGLVKRVEGIESVIRKNKVLWSNLRGLSSHTAILLRMAAWAILVALGSGLGGYIWVTLTGVSH